MREELALSRCLLITRSAVRARPGEPRNQALEPAAFAPSESLPNILGASPEYTVVPYSPIPLKYIRAFVEVASSVTSLPWVWKTSTPTTSPKVRGPV